MGTITDYFEQAQLALAAYALNLTPGISGTAYTDKLQAAGMSLQQATDFANTYTVIDQYTDSGLGGRKTGGRNMMHFASANCSNSKYRRGRSILRAAIKFATVNAEMKG